MSDEIVKLSMRDRLKKKYKLLAYNPVVMAMNGIILIFLLIIMI